MDVEGTHPETFPASVNAKRQAKAFITRATLGMFVKRLEPIDFDPLGHDASNEFLRSAS